MSHDPTTVWSSPEHPSPHGPPRPAGPGRAMAGWALGLSLAGFCLCGLAGWVGIALGLVVLFKAADGQDRGNRMAFAAVLIGWLGTAIGVIALGAFALPLLLNGTLATHVALDEVQADVRVVRADEVAVGQCITAPVIRDPKAAGTIRIVPCAAAHDGEAFSVFDLGGPEFPGEAVVDRRIQRRCDRDLERYTGGRHEDYQYWYPDAATWADGDRDVLCVLIDPDGNRLRGSLKE